MYTASSHPGCRRASRSSDVASFVIVWTGSAAPAFASRAGRGGGSPAKPTTKPKDRPARSSKSTREVRHPPDLHPPHTPSGPRVFALQAILAPRFCPIHAYRRRGSSSAAKSAQARAIGPSSRDARRCNAIWHVLHKVRQPSASHGSPPSAIRTRWWTSSVPGRPHFWHRQPSRSRIARRILAQARDEIAPEGDLIMHPARSAAPHRRPPPATSRGSAAGSA